MRSSRSSPLSQSMIQSPTSASGPGAVRPSSKPDSRPAVSPPNLRAACRHNRLLSSTRPCSIPCSTLLDALLAAFFDPLPSPFLYPFRQHGPHLLQRLHRGPVLRPETSRHQHPPDPFSERTLDLQLTRTSEPAEQRAQDPLEVRRSTAVFQGDQRRYQVAPGQIVFSMHSFVKQEVPVRGLVPRQRFVDRRDQRGHVFGRRPASGTVVQRHRQHRGQLPVRPQIPSTDELLVQQPGVDEHANRHVPVHRGLELELHYQVQPRGVAKAHQGQFFLAGS